MEKRKVIGVSLDKKLLARIDTMRGDMISRSRYIESLVEKALGGKR